MAENIAVNVGLSPLTGNVYVQFGELVKTLDLPPKEALRLALMLITAVNAKTEASAPAAPPSPKA